MNKGSGEKRRELKRKEHMEKVKSKAIELFCQAFPTPELVTSEDIFTQGWAVFEGSLLTVFSQQRDFRQAFKCGEHLLHQYKKQYHWSYSAPTTVVTNRLAKQTRDTKWLEYSWNVYDQYALWRKAT